MDENKEILTSENEAENTNTDTTAETTENTTFVADEPTESEEMSFAETEPANENGVTAPQPKKKSIIQLPIIIGIVIVAVATCSSVSLSISHFLSSDSRMISLCSPL